MKPVFSIALKSFFINTASCLLFFTGQVGFLVVFLSLLIQLILGIAFSLTQDKRIFGQGILLGLGVFLVIGFSVCTVILMSTGFH